VLALRESLETRHVVMPPASRLVVHATAHVRGESELAPSLARALVSTCLVEAASAAEVHTFAFAANRHFRFSTRPALDEPDRRQLRGCLEDLRIPRLKVTVQHTRVVGVPAGAGAPAR
jgi:hypothetical protein